MKTYDSPNSRSLSEEVRLSHLISMPVQPITRNTIPVHGVETQHKTLAKRRLIAILSQALALLDDGEEDALDDST